MILTNVSAIPRFISTSSLKANKWNKQINWNQKNREESKKQKLIKKIFKKWDRKKIRIKANQAAKHKQLECIWLKEKKEKQRNCAQIKLTHWQIHQWTILTHTFLTSLKWLPSVHCTGNTHTWTLSPQINECPAPNPPTVSHKMHMHARPATGQVLCSNATSKPRQHYNARQTAPSQMVWIHQHSWLVLVVGR